jgi:multidrug efflux pump subunit AcrA (membrane-fusion protein)
MPNNSEIRSEEIQDILTKVPHWMLTWGNSIVLCLLILFFVFTWFIKYPDIISAQAVITSQTPPQKVYANISGRIDTIMVSDSQDVKNGQILGMIENTAVLKDILKLKATVDTIHIQENNFIFPVDKIPLLSIGEISSSYAIFEKDYIDYTLNKTLDPYSNQITANQLSENELQLRLKSLRNQKQIDEKKFKLSENEFKRNQQLYDKGVISLNEYETKKLKFLEDEKQINNLEITFSQLQQSINDARKTSKETKIDNQSENTRLFKNVVISFSQLQDAIKSWELKYLLKSNLDGKISFINILNEKQNITQEDLLFTIVPTGENQYLSRIKAPIQNSGKIKPGQKVNIKLFNYPETEYGMLSGEVKSMSAIPNEDGFYLVLVSLKSPLTTSYNIEIPFKNEMTGTAEIVTDDLRLLERFFYQLRGIFIN